MLAALKQEKVIDNVAFKSYYKLVKGGNFPSKISLLNHLTTVGGVKLERRSWSSSGTCDIMMYRMVRRRRRTATTNYPKRIRELKGGMPRLVVRKSNRGVLLQVVNYEENGDKVVASATSKELKKMGWEPRCNIPTAYLTGFSSRRSGRGRRRST